MSTTAENDASLSPAEALARWSLKELDAAHAWVGLGSEWLASDRRAELAACVTSPGGSNA